ncbi:MAG: hypothetical protein NXH83_19460 [Rhodobacteraceae bacterium]|nr:hypothetical protein [Paracoccaceae bacterium]
MTSDLRIGASEVSLEAPVGGCLLAGVEFFDWDAAVAGEASGRKLPEDTGDRALATGVGALGAGIIGLIPLLGWIFILVLTLAGIGVIVLDLFKPRSYAGGGRA